MTEESDQEELKDEVSQSDLESGNQKPNKDRLLLNLNDQNILIAPLPLYGPQQSSQEQKSEKDEQ